MSTKLLELSVGSPVYLNVNSVRTKFLVVHQGLPSSDYDSSCDGTWLLAANVYTKKAFNNTESNSYASSTIHTYLNNTFFGLLDLDVASVVKTVKIPYTNGTGNSGSVAIGSNGLSTQIFLLSYTEAGASGQTKVNVEGSILSYFEGGYANDEATSEWWTRSPYTSSSNIGVAVGTSGTAILPAIKSSNLRGVRPAMILPSSLYVSNNRDIITSSAVNVGVYVNIDGVWKPVV